MDSSGDTIMIVGIMRSGDIRFSFYLETATMWGIGVVAAYIGAFVFHLPVYFVYACAMLDEIASSHCQLALLLQALDPRDMTQVCSG
jgi:Na+-driven multidrug efflux pump